MAESTADRTGSIESLEERSRSHLRPDVSRGSESSLEQVRRRCRRRRRSRRALGATVAVTSVAAAGVVVAMLTGGGGGETLVGAPDTTVPAPVTTVAEIEQPPPTPMPTSVTDDDADGATVGNDTAGEPPTIAAAPGADAVAWGTGFLVVDPVVESGRIEPLGEEILSYFSDAVRDLFDEQPTSIDEAVEVLSEHPELLAEVEAVLDGHPEVFDAIYGSRAPTMLEFSVSDDGRSWTSVGRLELPLPAEYPQAVRAHDGRLLVVGVGRAPSSEGAVSNEIITVAVSSDLSSWDSVDTIEPPAMSSTEFGPSSWVSGADIGPSGVVVAVETAARPRRPSSIWTGDPATGLIRADLDLGDGFARDVLAPPSGGFVVGTVEPASSVYTSPDGQSWTERQVGLDEGDWPTSVVPVPGGVGLVVTEPDGTVLWRSTSEFAMWERFEVAAGGPGGIEWITSVSGGPAGVAAVGLVVPERPAVPPRLVVIEREGVRLELAIGERGGRIRAFGPGANGPDTVLLDWEVDEEPPADRVEISDDGTLTILDPATGAPIASFAEEDAEAAFAEAYPDGEALDVDGSEARQVNEILFSPDGANWRVLDRLDDETYGDRAVGWSPVAIVVGNTTVLVVIESHPNEGEFERIHLVYEV